MLIFKYQKGLVYDNTVIKSSNTTLKLQSDIKAEFIGNLILTNGLVYTKPFEREGEIYKAKLNISKDILPFLKGSRFYLTIIDSTFSQSTNVVELVFDLELITLSIKREVGDEIKELYTRLIKIESEIGHLIGTGALKNIAPLNQKDIKVGMVPVATSTGDFVAAFPFADIVKQINGITAVNESIALYLKNIPYDESGRSSLEVIQLLLEVVKNQSLAIQSILKTQEKIINELKQLELDYAAHKNTALF
jgi:hypothetical protein